MNWDRLKQVIVDIVESVTQNYQYHGKYPSRVVSQNGDGTLEIQTSFPAMPSISSVKLKLGIPGTKVEVEPGSEVMLAFEAGQRDRPYVELFENSKMASLEIRVTGKYKIVGAEGELFEGGQPIARQGDPVAIGGFKVPPLLPAQMWPAYIQMPAGLNTGLPVPCFIKIGPKPAYGIVAGGRVKLKG